ncbi:glycosyl hydrolase family 18 protein [Lelliottia sp. V106_10]|uniref:glycosyl hydrolase family 18 protein n=1 Tax=Lelliottia wanjuensis TaxID=3050585 RepID=UPI00254E328A|nr:MULTISPECIES: glycosyl hydrolase family 18 protein [unclassified Lelliottia]MDK9354916.1 glycosyl hydrolase family 18 protein [Lelliottia sp. V106_16]MDK9372124.1 glycosyl hydrolase family 18 protein [Lelliottia sp. V106_10]MDK9598760.1 glycosyl hydrolase family 18 protein [Lelliottia sp. V106_5]
MTTSKLVKTDSLTEASYKADGFDASKETKKYSYTSARVAKPVYNKYNTANKPKVFGYYTDWSQYDSRQSDGDDTPENRGRGYDLANVSPTAYDKIILGFLGIVGDQGEKAETINRAAATLGKTKDQATFLDPWGDFQTSRNVGLKDTGWVEMDPSTATQGTVKGIVGGLRDLQAKAKAVGHTLTLSMSIGGWTMSNGFHIMSKTAASRTTFAKSVASLFTRFPMFSEVDIDWEYPGNAGNNNPYDDSDGPNYALLLAELSKQLKAINRSDVKISIASSAVVAILEKSDVKTLLNNGLYSINVMTYDFFGTPWATQLDHHTNLHALVEGGWGVDTIVNYLIGKGFPADRINVGYAAYSRNAQNAKLDSFSPLRGSYQPDSNATTTGTFESGSTEWYDLINTYLDLENQKGRNGFSVYTDQVADADYLYNKESKLFMSIETPRSVRAKGQYVLEKGLGALFTWTIDQDNGVLVNAAREGLGCPIVEQVIDMKPFYFDGVNVSGEVPEDELPDSNPDTNTAPVADIQLQVIGGSRVRLSGANSSDADNDALTYKWTVPNGISVSNTTTSTISFTAPVVVSRADFQFDLLVTDTHGAVSANKQFTLSVFGEDAVEPTPIPDPIPEPTPEPTPDPTPAPSGDYTQWVSSKIYNTGDKVSWKGKNYTANYWTQNNEPGDPQFTGEWAQWKLL